MSQPVEKKAESDGLFQLTFEKLEVLVEVLAERKKLRPCVIRSRVIYPSLLVGESSFDTIFSEEEEYVVIYLFGNRYDINLLEKIEIEINGGLESFSALEWASASGRFGIVSALLENDFFNGEDNPLCETSVSREIYLSALSLALSNQNILMHEFLRSMVLYRFSEIIEDRIKALISIYKILGSKGLAEISRQYQTALMELAQTVKKENSTIN